MKQIKMIALDLDRTTLNHNKELSPRTIDTLHRAMAQGVFVVAATGRSYYSLPKKLFDVDGLKYCITSNGAIITDFETKEVIYQNCIDPASVCAVVDATKTANLCVETFVDGKAYIGQKDYDEIMHHKREARDPEYVRQTRTPVPDIFDTILKNREKIENINLNFEELSVRSEWKERIAKIEQITLTSSFAYNLEIGRKTTSKASALQWLMKQLDITGDALMACGDSFNDIEMIKTAGIGVAVANASEDVKAFADYVTDTNDNDGVAKAIEKFVLRPALP